MDATGDRPSRVVIEDVDVYPVPPPVQKLHAHARRLDHLLLLDVPPFDLADGFLALLHRHRRGRDGRHFEVGRARLRVLRLAPAGEIVADEVIGRCLGQGMDVGGDTPVHVHAQVEGLFGVLGIGQRKACLAFPLANERMLVGLRNRQSGDDERRPGRDDLQRYDLAVGMGVPPGPEVVSPGIVARDFRLALARVAPVLPLVTPHLHRAPIREGDKRLAPQGDMADFKTLADGYADLLAALLAARLAARQPEHVFRDGDAQRTAFHQVRLQQAMGDNQSRSPAVDGNGHAAGCPIERDETLRGIVVYPEGQAAAQLIADGRIGFLIQDVESGVTQVGQVEGLVVWHVGASFRMILVVMQAAFCSVFLYKFQIELENCTISND